MWLEGQLRAGSGDGVPVVLHGDELAARPGLVLISVVRARRISRCAADDDPCALVPVADVEHVTGHGTIDGRCAGLGPASVCPDGFVVAADPRACRAQG